MDQQKIAKHLIELNETYLDGTVSTVSALHVDSQRRFFGFVDKNPVFCNNSKHAIYDFLVSSRKHKYEYRFPADEKQDEPSRYFVSCHARKGDK